MDRTARPIARVVLMPSEQRYTVSLLQGLQAHFKQPSGPSRLGTDWAISIASAAGERRVLVRTYADDVGQIPQDQEARLALEFVQRLLDSGWTPEQYGQTPGELVVPKE